MQLSNRATEQESDRATGRQGVRASERQSVRASKRRNKRVTERQRQPEKQASRLASWPHVPEFIRSPRHSTGPPGHPPKKTISLPPWPSSPPRPSRSVAPAGHALIHRRKKIMEQRAAGFVLEPSPASLLPTGCEHSGPQEPAPVWSPRCGYRDCRLWFTMTMYIHAGEAQETKRPRGAEELKLLST